MSITSGKFSRVLSIQSHVVRGYVGNRAAVFPLQLLGHHVDVIDTVSFTSMYIHEGSRFEGKDVKILLDTLPMAQLVPPPGAHPGALNGPIDDTIPLDHKYVLTGYIGSASLLKEVIEFLQHQKSLNAKFMWVCDPVIGDNGLPYVPIDVLDLYRDLCVPLADLMTPNQYELQWLCGLDKPIQSLEDAARCCFRLHERGLRRLVITSIQLPGQDTLTLLTSEKDPTCPGKYKLHTIEFPKLEAYLGGTGDLMAAMILDGLDRFNGDLQQSCLRALSILQGIMMYSVINGNCVDIDVIGSASLIQDPPKQNFKVMALDPNFPKCETIEN